MRMLCVGTLGLVVVGACSVVQLRGSSGHSGAASDPFQRPPVQPAVVRSGSDAGSEVRRVCRGSTPGGWIAIDYVVDSLSCPVAARRDQQHSTAVIVNYGRMQVSDELSVCADARVPRNWSRVRFEAADARCPGASRGDQPGVMVIRRYR